MLPQMIAHAIAENADFPGESGNRLPAHFQSIDFIEDEAGNFLPGRAMDCPMPVFAGRHRTFHGTWKVADLARMEPSQSMTALLASSPGRTNTSVASCKAHLVTNEP